MQRRLSIIAVNSKWQLGGRMRLCRVTRWLAGLFDHHVPCALADPYPIRSALAAVMLAHVASVSRAAFAVRFRERQDQASSIIGHVSASLLRAQR